MTDATISVKNTKKDIINHNFDGIHVFISSSQILISQFSSNQTEPWREIIKRKNESDIFLYWQQIKKDPRKIFFWKIPEENETINTYARPISRFRIDECKKKVKCIQFHPIPREWDVENDRLPIYPDFHIFKTNYELSKENESDEKRKSVIKNLHKLLGWNTEIPKIEIQCPICLKPFKPNKKRRIYCSEDCKAQASEIRKEIRKQVKKFYKSQKYCKICNQPIPKEKRSHALFCNECDIPWKRRAYFRDEERKKHLL